MKKRIEQPWILSIGTYPPRECGLATFSRDLINSLDNKFSTFIQTKVCAMNSNSTSIYNYPDKVMFQIEDSNIQEYLDLAKKINQIDSIKLVNVQHEFGIFGGERGSYLIPFLDLLEKPAVITFHTVLPNPEPKLLQVVQSIARKASCFVVMTEKAVDILRDDYYLNNDIIVIPHGIPQIPFTTNEISKKQKGYANRLILSSFGLMNRGKGYEYVIEALPEIIQKFPNLLYLILGETHPVVRRHEGEEYRNFLEKKVKELGLENHVKFYNKYMTPQEIIEYLEASDVYISSGLNQHQITSGTLVNAMGCGRAVVSTPFLHAKDIINEERGFLAKFQDPGSFAEGIIKILSNPDLKSSMERNAYTYTRKMTWSNVALTYMDLYNRYINSPGVESSIPDLNISHLQNITDEFGIIQFSNMSKPDPLSGYTLDDNARALLACCMHYKIFKEESILNMINKLLNFINYVHQENGRLYNYVDYNKTINKKEWSDDAHGRGLWSLGFAASTPDLPLKFKMQAIEIFNNAQPFADDIKSPRAVAFSILGSSFFNHEYPSHENMNRIKKRADYLVSLYQENNSKDWHWFEQSLSYSNSKLPESLFYAYKVTSNQAYLKVAEKTLAFLSSVTFEGGKFNPIGQNGWYVKDGHKAHFDQQPVDTAYMVQTLILAFQITSKKKYLENAITAFQWFLGNNYLRQVIYDEVTGGCHDGLGQFSVNLNQGAESTIAYILARLSLEELNSQEKISITLPEAIKSKEAPIPIQVYASQIYSSKIMAQKSE